MNQTIFKKFKGWAGLSTYDSWHPCDMERFYELVIESYKRNEPALTMDEFRSKMKEFSGRDVSDKIFEKFYQKYEDGIELLKIYNKLKNN